MDGTNETMQANASLRAAPRRHVLKVIVLTLLVIIGMAASAGSAYWWRDRSAVSFENKQAATIALLQSDKANLQKQLAGNSATSTKRSTETTCTPQAPDAATVANIEASITSGNTAALQGYMASSVNDVYAAAGTIPPKTPADSVSDITTFATDQLAGTWNFPVPAAAINSYKQGSYGQYFPSIAVVGSSTRHRVISFSFDCSAKINTVFMAADDAVLM